MPFDSKEHFSLGNFCLSLVNIQGWLFINCLCRPSQLFTLNTWDSYLRNSHNDSKINYYSYLSMQFSLLRCGNYVEELYYIYCFKESYRLNHELGTNNVHVLSIFVAIG